MSNGTTKNYSRTDIALGNIPAISHIYKYGENDAVGTTEVPIWDKNTPYYWIPTPIKLQVEGTSADDNIKAAGILTLSANVSDTETVTIGAKVYVFQTVLTDVDGNVLIGATASDSIDNLIAAINLAAGAGTTYALSTTANVITVSAAAGAGDTMDLTVATAGAIATEETSATASWGAALTVPGTGAWQVQIFGLGLDKKEYNEIINLDGTTPVESVNEFFRVFRAIIVAGDSRTGLIGDLDIYTTGTSANVVAHVKAGVNQTHMAIFTVPVNRVALVDNADANVGKGQDATFKFKAFSSDATNGVELVKATRHLFQNSFTRVYATPRTLPPLTDIWMEGITSAGTVAASASFEIRLFTFV